MDAWFWLVVAPPAAAAVLLIRRIPATRRRSLTRFARRVGLPVPEGIRARVEHLLWARNVSSELGAIAGVSLAAIWALISRSPLVGQTVWVLILIGAALTGAAAGAGWSAFRQTVGRADVDEPRLARPTASTLDDYVAPLDLHGGRVMALLPALLLLGVTVAGSLSDAVHLDRIPMLGAALVAVLSLAALAGSEVAGRRLIEQPQSAGSDLELAWSDALRSRVLRDLVTVPIAVGTYATFGLLAGLGDAIREGTPRTVIGGIGGMLAVAVVAIAVVSVVSRPQQQFRRRLWPNLDGDARAGTSRR